MVSPNPISTSDNKLKLGLFGLNVSNGCAMTDMPESLKAEWPESVAMARRAEAAGFEAIIPVARWRGMGGDVNFNHQNFETFTWAAGLAAATETISIFATFHVPTAHPVRAAKEVATIDHIADGRFGLNMVAGWNETEIGMFGVEQLEHDERYDYATDWLRACQALWTTPGDFDYEGAYFNIPNAYSEPKPLQAGGPVLMSAGNSPRGQRFAAEFCDLNFVVAPTIEAAGAIATEVKRLARDEFDRDIQVFGQGYIVCRDTEAEAVAYRDHYVEEKGDWDGVRNLLDVLIPNSESALGDEWEAMAGNLIAGYGAIPLVGTAEQVVDGMQQFSDAGLDGITVSWVDYPSGLEQYDEVLRPLLIEAGLRSS